MTNALNEAMGTLPDEELKIARGELPQMSPRRLTTIKFKNVQWIFDARLHELRESMGPGRVELRESESDMLDYAIRASSVKNNRMKLISAFMVDLAEQGRV